MEDVLKDLEIKEAFDDLRANRACLEAKLSKSPRVPRNGHDN